MAVVVEHRNGGWLPRDQRVVARWIANKIAQSAGKTQESHPVIQDFQTLIEQDAEIYMGFPQMFAQVPTKLPYNNDPTGKRQVGFTRFSSASFSSSVTSDLCIIS